MVGQLIAREWGQDGVSPKREAVETKSCTSSEGVNDEYDGSVSAFSPQHTITINVRSWGIGGLCGSAVETGRWMGAAGVQSAWLIARP